MFRSNQQVGSIAPYNGDVSQLPVNPSSSSSPVDGVYGGDFAIGLCECGSTNDFLYSCFCPSCAIASARYRLDRSDSCMNCTLLNPSLLRWLVRSAYHISGSPCEDCCYGFFCYICTINQALQTVKRRGPPHAFIGPSHNNIGYLTSKDSDPDCCLHCLTACCCSYCSMALISETALKMPCMFSCCCSNYCIMRNILRYQWHLQGTDAGDDCCLPIFMCILGMVPGLLCLCTWPYFVCDAMTMWKEAGRRGYTGPYLSLAVTTNPLAQAPQTTYPTAAATVVTTQPEPYAHEMTAAQANAMFLHNPVMLTLTSVGVTVLPSANNSNTNTGATYQRIDVPSLASEPAYNANANNDNIPTATVAVDIPYSKY